MTKYFDTNRKISVAFATNGVAHHITNFSEAILRNTNVNSYVLIVSDEKKSEEYSKLGRDDFIDRQLIKVVNASVDIDAALNVIREYDIVIATYAVDYLVRERIKTGKPTFIFSERVFKKYEDSFIISFLKNSLRFIKYKLLLHRGGYYNDNVFFLPAGKWAMCDYKLLGIKQTRMIPFGYFPRGVITKRTQENNSIVHLLWVGRLVKWKHPEYAIHTYKYLVGGGIM